MAVFSDGHKYCFSVGCEHYVPADGEYRHAKAESEEETEPDSEELTFENLPIPNSSKQKEGLQLTGECQALAKRGIREDTCQFFGYRVGEYNGKKAHLAYYHDVDTRRPVAAKVRFADKSFTFIGDPKAAPLYGQWLWRDGGKMLVITEGEIDALSVSQLQGNKWPVVSIRNGAQGASKDIRRAIEWIENFDTVVFMFDSDEPGRLAANECAALLKPGRAKVAHLPLKDANEMLVAGRGKEVIDAIWSAKTYRPDGVISVSDIREKVLAPEVRSKRHYPWQGLDDKLLGIRAGELITITAGSGIGKSLFCREIAYPIIADGENVGYIALEENVRRTVLGFVGIGLNAPVHLGRNGITDEDVARELDKYDGHLYLYDSFGSIETENLLSKIRYMAVGCECKYVFLDHISIAISGLEIEDERKAIDVMMTKLRSLVEETGITMFIVSHLKRPMGKEGHEDGLQVSLSHLRGSAAIAQLSDDVIALERDQQGENADVTTVRVLKNRWAGNSGVACRLRYDRDTGRLLETAKEDF